MMRCIFPLLFFVGVALFSAPVLVGVNQEGKCLPLGSGWHGTTARHAPAVSDDGLVTFIAPDEAEATTLAQAESFCATYQADITDSAPKSNLQYSGFDSALYYFSLGRFSYPKEAFGIRHFELVACGDTFARLTREFSGSLNDTGAYARGTYLKVGSQRYSFPQNEDIFSALAVSGNGTFAIVHNTQSNSYQLFSLEAHIQAQAAAIPKGTGRACLNHDGTAIWLASTEGLAGQSAGPLRLYRHNLSNRTTTFLATLQDTSETTFGLTDAQLSAAADTEAVALVSNTAVLWGSTPTVATVGRQVLLVTLNNNGNVTFTRCGTHFKGGAPAISADGRFVAFTATAKATSDTTQIYRYDKLTAKLEKASGEADKNCVCPAISSSGRFVAFVSDAGNLGADNGYPNVYGTDLGCTLTGAETFMAYIDMPDTLPFEVSGALPEDTLSLNWINTLPGTLTNAQGAIVAKGKPFSPSLLPLRFTASQKGMATLTATLSNGQSSTLALYSSRLGSPTTQLVSAKEDGTLYLQGNYYGGFRIDGSVAFSADGTTILFSTTAPLSNDDTDTAPDAYAYNLSTNHLTRLTNGIVNAQHFAFSADGTTCAALVEGEIQVFAGGMRIATIVNAASAPALSSDGSAIAFIGTDGMPKLYRKDSLTTLVTPASTACSSPWISANGKCVACLQNGALLLWKDPHGSPVTVATNVTSFSATSDAS